jgi:hypothetical protein
MIPPFEDDGFESALARLAEAVADTNGRPMIDFPDTYRMVSASGRADTAAREAALFAPDIVIDFAGLYPRIDGWVSTLSGKPPFYILPPSQAHSPVLLEEVADDPSLRTRVIGVNHAGPDADHKPIYDAYLERFAAISPANVDGAASVNVYEAVYFLTYAAVAGGTGGTNMNRGMTRLLGLLTNSRRDIGPAAIDSVVELLGSEPSLSLHGALGPPGFHSYSGARRVPASAWCIDENLRFAMDVLSIGPDEHGRTNLVGDFRCYDP